MDERETAARIALCAVSGLRDADRAALLRRHGSAAAVLEAGPASIGMPAFDQLHSPVVRRRLRRIRAVCETLQIQVLACTDPTYPLPAEPIEAPPILFARGDVGLLRSPGVAVVGTRRSTEYGEDVAEELSGALVRAGVTVISGLARGIDGVAHRTALAAGGSTIAVLGCGIDVVYPREHGRLQEEIATAGLLLSEFLPGEPPRPYFFLKRNRLIAGYAAATVVVEGGATSGAINTAHHALRADLPVFGVPGPLGRGTSEGPNALIRDGAHLYTEPLDVLLAIGRAGAAGTAAIGAEPIDAAPAAAVGPETRALPTAGGAPAPFGLRREARHIDAIAAAAGEPTSKVLARLLELELDGLVEQLPGMRFRLTPAALTAAAPAAKGATAARESGRHDPAAVSSATAAAQAGSRPA